MGTAFSPIVFSLSPPAILNTLQSDRSSSSQKPCVSLRSRMTGKKFRGGTLLFGMNPRESNGSMFRDENGVINDMDGYLNYLSLEYDSVWDTKPAWCQPWTITLTGVSAIAFSWLILHSVLVTGIVFFLIGAWWYIFLYSYPKAYSEMIAERRKKVTDGVEDTYGQQKPL